jgi:hypothetical protein
MLPPRPRQHTADEIIPDAAATGTLSREDGAGERPET